MAQCRKLQCSPIGPGAQTEPELPVAPLAASHFEAESDNLNLQVVILTIRVTPVLSRSGGLAAAADGPKAAQKKLENL